ncbi:hypothetical protein ACHAXS_006016, partial [Conticribra weissflogii]
SSTNIRLSLAETLPEVATNFRQLERLRSLPQKGSNLLQVHLQGIQSGVGYDRSKVERVPRRWEPCHKIYLLLNVISTGIVACHHQWRKMPSWTTKNVIRSATIPPRIDKRGSIEESALFLQWRGWQKYPRERWRPQRGRKCR